MASVAIVGAGWAGLAAAVRCVQAGHQVTVFEAARHLGGRARSLDVEIPGAGMVTLDNGQHIMIGAYTATLDLMQLVGVQPERVLHAMPLALRRPDGSGIALPAWPAPLDAAWGIARASGWSWRDKWSLLRASLGWQLARFRCAESASVSDIARHVSPRVMRELIEPLCVSALNTPAAQSSGAVFLRVLRDSLFGRGWGCWGGSWLLLPTGPLGELLPEAAGRFLLAHGAALRPGHRVQSLQARDAGWELDGQAFDAVVLACPVREAAHLLEHIPSTQAWRETALALDHEPICTVYATSAQRLSLPMLSLESSEAAPAQFVFDRGQLGGPAGLLAFVTSASRGDRETLERQVVQQARALGWNDVVPVMTVVEKRATFACRPGTVRPAQHVAPGLWACGDYVKGPYPATIEGAVRCALEVADALTAARRPAR